MPGLMDGEYGVTVNADTPLGAAVLELVKERDELLRQVEALTQERDGARAELDFYQRREASICAAVGEVANDGRYRADIVGRLQRVYRERDEARAELEDARGSCRVWEQVAEGAIAEVDRLRARIAELEARHG